MNLAQLEARLREKGIPHGRAPDGSVVLSYETFAFRGPGSLYPMYFTEAPGEQLRAKINLRRIAVHEIEYVDAFCRFVADRWSPVEVVFEKLHRRFCLFMLIDPSQFGEDIGSLLTALYQIEPVCLCVGKTGKWVEEFHELARIAEILPTDTPH